MRHALIALILTLGLLSGPAWAQEADTSGAAPMVVDDATAGAPEAEAAPAEAPPPTVDTTLDRGPEPTVAVDTCGAPTNPWGFTFCGGQPITRPPADLCSVFACIPTFWRQTNGYVIECADGLLSHSGGRAGSCSGHHGNGRTLFATI